jgi:hypothetical protein
MSRDRIGYLKSSIRPAALAAVIMFIGSGAGAQTAEIDADLSKYCRETFPNSAYQMRPQPWGPEHYCNQGGTLQGIDLAAACEATAGSRRFRVFGTRVLCADGGGAASAAGDALTTQDLVRYCAAKFPNSVHEQRAEATGPVHYCRRPGASGGFTLQNIDLADACSFAEGDGGYRIDGNRIICSRDVANRQPARPAPETAARSDRKATAAPANEGGRADETPPDRPEAADTDTDGGKAASAGKPAPGDRPAGVWRMTAGVLAGMKMRFDWSGDEMTGTITELPDAAARTARDHYGLSVGDAVVVGRLDNGNLVLRTRLGLVGLPEWVRATCPGSLSFFNQYAANRWSLPGWFPVFQLTWQGGRIVGRHGGTEFVQTKNNPAPSCTHYGDPFNPEFKANQNPVMHQYFMRMAGGIIRSPIAVDPAIRLPRFAVRFELEKVEETCASAENTGEFISKYRALVARLREGGGEATAPGAKP